MNDRRPKAVFLAGFLAAFTSFAVIQSGCKTGRITSTGPEGAEANQRAVAVPPPKAHHRRPLPTLYVVGDSTVHNSAPGLKGWGDVVGSYFDPAKIKVANHARPGRSSRTFQTQGWWSNILATAQSGDFVVIQLGHNDGGPLNDTNRARGTIRGIGEEVTNIVNALTHKPEVVHTYGWYMRKYVADARDKGMTPIICSPVPRLPKRTVAADTVDTDRYVAWSREVAVSQNVAFIDLNHLILQRYVGMMPAEIKTNYFTPHDNTHFSPIGAKLNAECVIQGLRTFTNLSLGDYLR